MVKLLLLGLGTPIMRRLPLLALVAALAALAAVQAAEPPGAALAAWAYPTGEKTPFPSVAPGIHTGAGGSRSLPAEQINDESSPPDWTPESHPPAPDIVAHGRKDGPIPCAACHFMNGSGYMGAPE